MKLIQLHKTDIFSEPTLDLKNYEEKNALRGEEKGCGWLMVKLV